jgi:hypothetical protein
MAYMSQETKKALTPAIKAVLRKYGAKGTISVRHYSTLVVTVSQSNIDFELDGRDTQSISHPTTELNEVANNFVNDMLNAMNGVGVYENHDNSDAMTDYFDVGWYVDLSIGSYKKPYKLLLNQLAA